MPNKIDKLLKQFLKELENILGNRLKKVLLYGSYARGDYNRNSDLDIMILTDLSDEEIIEYRNKIWDVACNMELENDIIISPLVKNIQKYNERIDIVPFYTNVQKEGVVLHG